MEGIETELVQGLAAVERNDPHEKLIIINKNEIEVVDVIVTQKHLIPSPGWIIKQSLPGETFETVYIFGILQRLRWRYIKVM